ncbi:class I SAM-dependent methyltransferase [Ideonella sp. YS5]|uniref:class I SAM-dependent methyltransferase n=1 Tax=Ideonella sp. YS5 TaxID=3453714 RepID=UPI003EEEA9A4
MKADTRPDETDRVRERYSRRASHDVRYSLLNPAALAALQERQRALLRLFAGLGWSELSGLDLIEVGSGSGGNLLDFLRFGFAPERLAGIELLADRHAVARHALPESLRLMNGNALELLPALAPADVVFQATVFSSLLDDAFQEQLAEAMWSAVKPGGGILWYDFTVDNPRNPDVRGVPLSRVRALFPQGRLQARRLTLAPPLARAAVRLHPGLYTVFNTLPFLRTHLLCWIAKD